MDIVKSTNIDYHVPILGLWLSEEDAKELHDALSEALGRTTHSTLGDENTFTSFTDRDGDVWREQDNGRWAVYEWNPGIPSSSFNDVNAVGLSRDKLSDLWPGGTWR